MNEFVWLNENHLSDMLSFLRESGQFCERKARLFSAACCRAVWDMIPDRRSRKAVEVTEKVADGSLQGVHLSIAHEAADEAASERRPASAFARDADRAAVWASGEYDLVFSPSVTAGYVAESTMSAAELKGTAREVAEAQQSGLLRDLLGPLPFRPLTVAPSVFGWAQGQVIKLAKAAYAHRELPAGHLVPARLAILADALDEAGCEDAEILGHLRGPGPHVRGCWAVDLVRSVD
jgi:hypothetical protein